MLSIEEVEDVLPSPIKIKICCDNEDFIMETRGSFNELLVRHNEEYETKIEQIARHYLDIDIDELYYNEFKIYIGKELIYNAKGPDFSDTREEMTMEEYYRSVVTITEGILNAWHDKIIEVQEENQKKLQELEEQEYYEMLYRYYSIRLDRRAFQYLKKLAARYPNSKYMNSLRRVYKRGSHGWHRKSDKLDIKLRRRGYEKNF